MLPSPPCTSCTTNASPHPRHLHSFPHDALPIFTPTEDGMIVEGPTPLTGGRISAYNDHRIAMMGVVASLIATEPVDRKSIRLNSSHVAISYACFCFNTINTTSYLRPRRR